MRDKLLAIINDAIEEEREIGVSLESGTNAISSTIVPNAVDEGENNITMYSEDGVVVIDTSDIQQVEAVDEFICLNSTSIITISY